MRSPDMRTNETGRTGAQGRLHPVVRVLLYFIALAVVNRIAFAAVAALLPSIPGWLLDLLEGGVYLAGVLALTWAFLSLPGPAAARLPGPAKAGLAPQPGHWPGPGSRADGPALPRHGRGRLAYG